MLYHFLGVPRSKRGEVWISLAERFSSTCPPVQPDKFPNYNIPYENLLKQLTSHQHAILIDLGNFNFLKIYFKLNNYYYRFNSFLIFKKKMSLYSYSSFCISY